MLCTIISSFATCTIFWAADFVLQCNAIDNIYSTTIDRISDLALFYRSTTITKNLFQFWNHKYETKKMKNNINYFLIYRLNKLAFSKLISLNSIKFQVATTVTGSRIMLSDSLQKVKYNRTYKSTTNL